MTHQLAVSEVFLSIQGESTWAGLPCAFIRLAGCPLRCTWCDTAYAFEGGRTVEVADAVCELAAFGCSLVEVTGGEPLAQPGAIPLMQALLDAGNTVLLETSGALPIDCVPAAVHRIVDIKCPGSGEAGGNLWENLDHLTERDELKLVVASRSDYEWARDAVRERRLDEICRAVHFSPVLDAVSLDDLAGWILADRLFGVRLQPQLHRIIWPGADRGV